MFMVGLFALLVKERVLRRYVDLTFDPAVVCMVIGLAVFCLASCGCVGALRENLRLLSVYKLSLSLIFVVSIVMCVLIFLFSSASLRSYGIVERALRRAVVIYRDDPDMEDFINRLQISFHCCGISLQGYMDWRLNPYFNCSELNYSRERCGVPYSCCKNNGQLFNVMCGYDVTDAAKEYYIPVERRIFTEGCLSALRRAVKENGVLLSAISGVLVGSLAVGITFTWLLMHSIREATGRQQVVGRDGRRHARHSARGHVPVMAT